MCCVLTRCRSRWHRIARGHLRSRVMQRLVSLHQSRLVTALTSAEATPVFLGGCQLPRRGLIPPRKPNDATARASCRATPSRPTFARLRSVEPRTHSTNTHQGIHFQGSKRLPPIGPFCRVPTGAENMTWGPPLVPWLSRLGPASDTHSPVSLQARSGG